MAELIVAATVGRPLAYCARGIRKGDCPADEALFGAVVKLEAADAIQLLVGEVLVGYIAAVQFNRRRSADFNPVRLQSLGYCVVAGLKVAELVVAAPVGRPLAYCARGIRKGDCPADEALFGAVVEFEAADAIIPFICKVKIGDVDSEQLWCIADRNRCCLGPACLWNLTDCVCIIL